ncbi:hypothetical protein SPOG_00306 [Schizosaccharomyces cryophilus OY26]|uniref:Uncharacterized protein n=1 Tax=Schizosaccharomyces cryophilus (strain OY26 / ATCC MYA-4695 / CBS 11777 / NBRC 106824 / NRRL Y48691) TaxID=653667 RepID=S9W0F7_SCHCR|nr:uncharacterized protein SPOG_00306 [Schizosaccharomyces cryophilus OY26]EPY51884.1 hypothetical protein SPOG_00306 [Schizosaccharomyces cryophilus OY26]
MSAILLAFSFIYLSINFIQAAQIHLRRGIDDSPVWQTIYDCLSRHFDGKAIVDRILINRDKEYTVWADVGNNVEHTFDESIADAITKCVSLQHPNITVNLRSHNQFAVRGSRYTEHVVDDFYDFFGHGYPADYTPGNSSDEDDDEVLHDDYVGLERRGIFLI